MDKISVIVPVWNGESFLKECVESICRQTYQNLEILLVDDGSTDKSLEMCKEFAKKDERIQVFHKENGGQASARNYALERATGDMIGFVDDDDWIYPTMYEKLHQYMVEYQADIARCSDEFDRKGQPVSRVEIQTMEGEEYFGNVYQDIWYGHVTDRLFRREVIGESRFPHSKTIEDMRFMRLILPRAHKEVVTNEKLYFYTVRGDSTSYVYAKNHINSYERAMEFQSRYEESREKYPRYQELMLYKATTFSSGTLHLLLKKRKEFEKEYDQMKSFLKKYRKEILKSRKIPWKYKVLVIFM